MAPHLVLVSDLDHTMVQNEDLQHKRLLAFNHVWTTHRSDFSLGLLMFSTGALAVCSPADPWCVDRMLVNVSEGRVAQIVNLTLNLFADILICSVGTEVFYNTHSPVIKYLDPEYQDAASGDGGWMRFAPDKQWERFLDVDWDRGAVERLVAQRFPQLTKQADSEQRPHKISYTISAQQTADPRTPHTPVDVNHTLNHPATNTQTMHSSPPPPPTTTTTTTTATNDGGDGHGPHGTGGGHAAVMVSAEDLVRSLRHELKAQGQLAKVIFSGGRDLDVLAPGAGKGCALSFVLDQLRCAGCVMGGVLVNGDSGNDAELMEVKGVLGCVVGNAHAELREHARKMAETGEGNVLQARNPCAAGIVEAMIHFGFLSPTSPILLEHDCLVNLAPGAAAIAAQGSGSSSGPVFDEPSRCIHTRSIGVDHKPDTNAIPAVARPAPPPGALVIEGGYAEDVPESGPAIDSAANQIVQTHASSDAEVAGPGDMAFRRVIHTSKVLRSFAGLDEGGSKASPTVNVPPIRHTALCTPRSPENGIGELSTIESVCEWMWRLGGALAVEFARGWLKAATASDQVGAHATVSTTIPRHSTLRLFVTNECVVEHEPLAHVPPLHHQAKSTPATTSHTSSPASRTTPSVDPHTIAPDSQGTVISTPAAVPGVIHGLNPTDADERSDDGPHGTDCQPDDVCGAEILDDMTASGAADASEYDAGRMNTRSWIDGRYITCCTAGEVELGSAGDASFITEFQVCTLTPDGQRSPHAWRCRAEGGAQEEAVPHGYLAHKLVLSGPLPPHAMLVHFDSTPLRLPSC